ncbi:unannotated protein [freshwater metagenome]|uniref:Unannotated protein n=1 Tax=freshwater metagenome TaxID=449393 RepID=A0A6J7NZJ1_9ZZZZ
MAHLPQRTIKYRNAIFDQQADFTKSGVLAYRCRAGATKLDAGVLSRVVASREHGTGDTKCARCVVETIGAG